MVNALQHQLIGFLCGVAVTCAIVALVSHPSTVSNVASLLPPRMNRKLVEEAQQRHRMAHQHQKRCGMAVAGELCSPTSQPSQHAGALPQQMLTFDGRRRAAAAANLGTEGAAAFARSAARLLVATLALLCAPALPCSGFYMVPGTERLVSLTLQDEYGHSDKVCPKRCP